MRLSAIISTVVKLAIGNAIRNPEQRIEAHQTRPGIQLLTSRKFGSYSLAPGPTDALLIKAQQQNSSPKATGGTPDVPQARNPTRGEEKKTEINNKEEGE